MPSSTDLIPVLWWIFAVLLILIGLAGTVLPPLPGTLLVRSVERGGA